MTHGHYVALETSSPIDESLRSKRLDTVDGQGSERIAPCFFNCQRSLAAQVPRVDDLRVAELRPRYPALLQPKVHANQGIALHQPARFLRGPREVLILQP